VIGEQKGKAKLTIVKHFQWRTETFVTNVAFLH